MSIIRRSTLPTGTYTKTTSPASTFERTRYSPSFKSSIAVWGQTMDPLYNGMEVTGCLFEWPSFSISSCVRTQLEKDRDLLKTLTHRISETSGIPLHLLTWQWDCHGGRRLPFWQPEKSSLPEWQEKTSRKRFPGKICHRGKASPQAYHSIPSKSKMSSKSIVKQKI